MRHLETTLISSPVSAAVRVAVVGGGPRGLSALERLVSTAAEHPETPVDITVFEPFRLGSGRVWRRDQSRNFLMNTPSSFPTVVPSEATLNTAGDAARPVVGPLTFDAFRQSREEASLTEAEAAELDSLTSADYPRRATYGAYLEHVAARIESALPEHVTVEHVRQTVTGLERREGGFLLATEGAPEAPWQADAVILAIGHVDAHLNPGQARLREKAGGAYFPPSIPSDVDWSLIPEGARVVIRGMGLNFFDVVTELTQGRGGVMTPLTDSGRRAFEYTPSGREPQIVALSRRGLPYAAKPDFTSPDRASEPVFATHARLTELLASAPVNFMDSVWPLISADAQLEYWAAMAENDDDAAGLSPELGEIRRLAEAGEAEPAMERLEALTQARPQESRLDLERLAKKIVGREFSGGEEHRKTVLEAIESDDAEAVRADSSPSKRAVAVVNQIRWLLKEFIPQGLLTDASRHKDLRGWFEPLIESLASGPPSQRTAELAALIRAGIVRIAGPSPVVSAGPALQDEPSGGARFLVTSPWVPGAVEEGDYFIEAIMPANAVASLDSPLVASLVAGGLAQPHRLFIDGAGYAGTGFEVDGPARRMVGADGPVPGLYCLGLQLSSTEWGTAIAASTDSRWRGGALTLADADAMARDILS